MKRLGSLPPWARKWPLLALAPVLVGSLLAYPLLQRGETKKRDRDRRLAQLAESHAQMKAEYEGLKKRYAELESDRDNVLKQTKTLLQEKSKWTGVQEELEELRKANQALVDQKDKLHRDGQQARAQVERLQSGFERVKTAYQELTANRKAMEAENAELRKSLTQAVERSPQYRELDKAFKEVRTESARQKETIAALDGKLKGALERVRKIQDRDAQFSKQIQALKAELDAAAAERDALRATNAELNKAVNEAPKRFKDMAEQNKRLLKETGEMHYNLGVFFAQNQLFDRAAKEFERTLEFNANDARAHYNLGYVYSEHLEQHAKAMRHFDRYLQLDPNGRDNDTVRAYLLSRQAYGDRAAPAEGKKVLQSP